MQENRIFESLAQRKQYKYPYFLLGIYVTFLLTTVCLASKLTLIGNLLLPGGIFAFMFPFTICIVVGEVYGYAYPRMFIWIGILAEFIFSFVVTGVSHLNSPEYFKFSEAYKIVFDPTLRYVLAGLTGLWVGEFVNIYLLAKWKIFCSGRLFILRSLVSMGLGQASLTIIVDILNYADKVTTNDLIWMMISGYAWKMVIAFALIFPAWLLVKHLKKVENVDYFDLNTNFNPFKLSLEDTNSSSSVVSSSYKKQRLSIRSRQII
jgi:uncharacterized integral membrane protein (TIGR00697 family)